MPIELYSREQQGDAAESRRLARVRFLQLIPEMKPDCVSDLSRTTFLDFVFVASERFKDHLLDRESRKNLSGSEIFARLFVQAFQQVVADGLVNKSIGDLLFITFGKYHAIDSSSLEKAFCSFEQLNKLDYGSHLCKLLKSWSRKWNLDEEWCRDNALLTLCNTLCADSLKWSFLHEITLITKVCEAAFSSSRKDVITKAVLAVFDQSVAVLRMKRCEPIDQAWHWSALEATRAVLWSRVELNVKVYGGYGDPEPFKFRWGQLSFIRSGFNSLKESQTRYKRRTELEFRLYLTEVEREALTTLLQIEGTPPPYASISSGLLQRFRKKLDQHVGRELRRTKNCTKHLIRTKNRPALEKHLRWTVDYHLYPGKSLIEIAGAQVDPSSVARAVNDSLELIGLRKRRDAKPGRIPGSTNKYSKTLRNLGR